MKKWKTICVINPYCKRTCFLAVDEDYEKRGKSIEEIYNDSHFFSFDLRKATREVTRHNFEVLNTKMEDTSC